MGVPKKVVSGSEVLYGPVGIATQTINGAGITVFDQDSTILNLYFDVSWAGGNEMQERPNNFLGRHPQPNFFHVPNRGSYRMEFTGDIGVFKDDYIHFKLLDPSHQKWKHPDVNRDAIILSFRLMKAAKINCYYDGRLQVRPSDLPDAVLYNKLTSPYSSLRSLPRSPIAAAGLQAG